MQSTLSRLLSSLLMVAALAVLPTNTFGQTPDFLTTANLSANDGIALDARVVSTGNNVYVVWDDDTPPPVTLTYDAFDPVIVYRRLGNYEIFLRKSGDGGATFEPIVNLSNTTDRSTSPRIAVVDQDVYVVWVEGSGTATEIYLRHSSDGGVTFGAPVNISNTSGRSTQPMVAVAGTTVHVAWLDESSGNPDVYLASSGDAAATFNTPVQLSSGSAPSSSAQLAVAGSNVYVSWQDGTGSESTVHLRVSPDAGASFGGDASFGGPASELPLLVVSDLYVHLAWTEAGDVFTASSADAGVTFGAPVNVSNTADRSIQPQLAADGAHLYVAWLEKPVYQTVGKVFASSTFFRRSIDGGVTFESAQAIGAFSANPTIAISGQSVFVAWVTEEMFVASSVDRGASFARPINFGSKPYSTVELSANGATLSAIWMEVWVQPPGGTSYRNQTVTDVYFRSGVPMTTEAVPPSGSVVVNNQDPYTNTTTATLTLSCTDPVPASGCAEMQIAVDGIIDTEVYEPFVSSKSVTLPAGDGPKTVAVRFRDAAGNTSEAVSDSISLDSTAPAFSSLKLLANSGEGNGSNLATPIVRATGGRWQAVWGSDAMDVSYNARGYFGEWLTDNLRGMTVGRGTTPDLAVSGEDVYAAWVDLAAGGGDIVVRTSYRQYWGSPQVPFGAATNVSASAVPSAFPTLAAYGERLYVVWLEDTQVGFRASTDKGATWQPLQMLGTADTTARPAIAVSGMTVYVLWTAASGGYGDVFVRVSHDGGATFGAARNLSNSQDSSRAPRLVVVGQHAYVVWEERAEGSARVMLASTHDGGTAFGAPILLGDGESPQVAAAGTHVYVAWSRQNTIDFRASADAGATFEAAASLGAIYSPTQLRIAATATHVYIVWPAPGVGSDDDIFMRASNNFGERFAEPFNLGRMNGQSKEPQIAVDGNEFHVVWLEQAETAYQVLPFAVYIRSGLSLALPGHAVADIAVPAYGVDEGASITVAQSGADPNDPALTFSWDLDDDGTFETPGSSVTFSAAEVDGPSSHQITLRVTDNFGLSQTTTAIVLVGNRPPVVDGGLDRVAVVGEPVAFQATIVDPGIGDTHTITWSFGDGTPQVSGTIAPTHTFAFASTFTVTITVTDDDGAASADTLVVSVRPDGARGQAPNFRGPQTLSQAGNVPDIAAAGANVYVAWQEDEEIRFARSTDNGSIFGPPINLSNNAGFSRIPRVATSGSNVYVVWQDNTSGNWEILLAVSTDSGITFGQPIDLSNDPEVSLDATVAASGPMAYVAWHDYREIWLRASETSGATFGAAVNASNTASDSDSPSLAAEGDNVYLAWTDLASGNRDVLFAVSSDRGASFGPYAALTTGTGPSSAELHASTENVYALLLEAPPGSSDFDVFIRTSTDRGMSFGNPLNLSDDLSNAASADVTASGGAVYAAWAAQGNVWLRRSIDGGATFLPRVSLASSSGFTRLAAAGEDLYVVWGGGTLLFRGTTPTVDAAAPTGTVTINMDNPTAYSRHSVINLACSDAIPGTGCAEMQVAIDGIADTEPFEPLTSSKRVVLTGGNGQKTVAVRFRDAEGNVSAEVSDTIYLSDAGTTLQDVAAYTFQMPDPTGNGSRPDPSVWRQSSSGNVQVVPFEGIGLGISDPDSTASLVYSYPTAMMLPGSTASLRAVLQVPGTSSQAEFPWHLVLDDGRHRALLKFIHDWNGPSITLADTFMEPIPFSWHNGLDNTYELRLLANGDFQLLATNAETGATVGVTRSAALMPTSLSTPQFGWGMTPFGSGIVYVQSIRGEVHGDGPPANTAPVAHAGGPYSVVEGGVVLLAGAGTDVDGDALEFAWDLNQDGTFETPGANVAFSAASLDGPSTHTVSLRVTDARGLSNVASAAVAIGNAAPASLLLSGPSQANAGSPVTLTAAFVDPGTGDSHVAEWDFGDGTTSSEPLPAGARTVSRAHTFGTAGAYVVQLKVVDDDGGQATGQAPIEVRSAPPRFDPPLAPQTVDEGQTHSWTVRAVSASAADVLTLTTTDLPPGASFVVDPSSGSGAATATLEWTPSCIGAGEYPLTIRASGQNGETVQETVTITANEMCQPVIAAVVPLRNEVLVLDAQHETTLQALLTGQQPVDVAIADDFDPLTQATVHTVNRNGTLSVFRQAAGAGLSFYGSATLPIGRKPGAVAVTPDGAYAWVGSADTGSVLMVDRHTDVLVGSVTLGGRRRPTALAFTPDGARAYVASRETNELLVIDVETAMVDGARALVAAVRIAKPTDVAVAPSGAHVYVSGGRSLTALDASTLQAVFTTALPVTPGEIGVVSDGGKIYVTLPANNAVAVIRGQAPFDLIRQIPVGATPGGIAVARAGSGLDRMFVGLAGGDAIAVIDTANDTIVTTVPVGNAVTSLSAVNVRRR